MGDTFPKKATKLSTEESAYSLDGIPTLRYRESSETSGEHHICRSQVGILSTFTLQNIAKFSYKFHGLVSSSFTENRHLLLNLIFFNVCMILVFTSVVKICFVGSKLCLLWVKFCNEPLLMRLLCKNSCCSCKP